MDKNTLSIPFIIIVVIANFFLSFLFPGTIIGNAIYNVIRAAAIAYAGWLVVRRGGRSIWFAALVGVLLFALDHLVLRGGSFLFDAYVLKQTPSENISAFWGVVISYFMFAIVAAAVAIAGGLASRWMAKQA